MVMKIDSLLRIMAASKIRFPASGTGPKKRIVARDFERAIGDHFYERDFVPGTPNAQHMDLRRAWTPSKAYRFDKLKPLVQESLFVDDNGWIAEPKINGWRLMVTFIPHTNPHFYGGNLSTVNFLPTDYTNHILLSHGDKTAPATDKRFVHMLDKPCILDCEVTVQDIATGEEMSDHYSLTMVQEILGSNSGRALMLQQDTRLVFTVFDYIDPSRPKLSCTQRKMEAATAVETLANPSEHSLFQFRLIDSTAYNKKAYVNSIWNAGGEGIVLKNVDAVYIPGSRSKDIQIKVKRVHSDTVGSDIDAWISDVYNTPEWDKRGLIGGVELSVYLTQSGNTVEHVIAQVTSMPDAIRESITADKIAWLDKVVIVDGQELSSKNRRLMHARVNWDRGVRLDKSPMDCEMELEDIENVMF